SRTRRRPATRPWRPAARVPRSRAALSTRSGSPQRTSPAGVRFIPEHVRSNSFRPNSDSRALIWALTAGRLVKRRSAAWVSLPTRATATNVCSWYNSMAADRNGAAVSTDFDDLATQKDPAGRARQVILGGFGRHGPRPARAT